MKQQTCPGLGLCFRSYFTYMSAVSIAVCCISSICHCFQGLQPTRLFSDEAQVGCHPTVHSYEPCDVTGRDSAMPGPAHIDSSGIRDVSSRSPVVGGCGRTLTPCSLIEALERAHCGMVNFTGRVERVYRRKMTARREHREEGMG